MCPLFSLPKSLQRSMRVLLAALPLMFLLLPAARAQTPAQVPLLNTSGGGVPPNFMLTLDDSGSMQFKHMPENQFAGGTFLTTNPVGSNTVRWAPSDTYQFSVNPFGTVPGNITSTNYVLRALRSPDTNSIFYNPDIRYRPWAVSTYPLPIATLFAPAGRMANSPPAAAFLDPVNPTGGVINLTSYSFTAVPGSPGGSGTWCYFDTTYPPSVAPATPPVISIKSLVTGLRYTIVNKGTSDFRTVGSNGTNNVNGGRFIATGFGNAVSGTGTARADTPPMTSCALRADSDPLVVNHDPGVYFRLQTQTVAATAMVKDVEYTILTLGNTNYTLVGAPANTPGLIFKASGPGSGTGTLTGYQPVTNFANYAAYSINGLGPFPKTAARTDCSGTVGSNGCSKAEERQNFANWFTYYRNRNLLARGAMMEAFATVGNTIRLGFGRINKGSGTVDGVSTSVIESNIATYGGGGVRPFNQVRKNQLFKWLEDLPASGGTPLPAALDAVGTYYSRTDAQGPYTDDPSVATNSVTANKTCRRSYQLMVTDGYWNGATSVGDQDTDPGINIVGPGASQFTFPANTLPYKDGIADTLADVAMKYWKTDIQPGINNEIRANSADSAFWQTMTNYMVGLGVRGSLDPAVDLPALSAGTKFWSAPSATAPLPANIDDLWHAAVNSRGAYYSAKDPATLASAVAGALVGAQGGTGSTAGVATVSSVLQNGNRKYVPSYNGNVWSGDIVAQPLGANGQATTAVWNASAKVPAHGSRNIFTWDNSPILAPSTPGAVAFDWSLLSSANQTAMTSGSSDVVDFLRGDHGKEVSLTQPLLPFRARKDAAGAPFVLGDFVNSNPVLIKGLFDGGYGNLNLGGVNGYQLFVAAKAARDAVLFVGGNDGMLHGFKDVNAQPPAASSTATDGVEVFAYVPRAVYSNLSKLSDPAYGSATVPHQFFVDGPQREFDAFVRGPGATAGTLAASASWRNYLVGSLGAGGKAIYALDVTSSPTLNALNVRWEISDQTDSDMGYVMAPIEVGVLPSGKWVALFGNGFSSTNGYATLFIVDLETAAITKVNVDTGGNNGLGGVGVLKNINGEITNLYAGDLKGQLWKFNYNTPSVPFVVDGGGTNPFFKATTTVLGSVAQAITQPPSIFRRTPPAAGHIVVFGTGKLFSTTDATNTDTQTMYGIWDNPTDSILPTSFPRPLGRPKLATRTLTAVAGTGAAAGTTFFNLAGPAMDWTVERGWQIDLSNILTGGRVIYPSQVYTSKLVFITAVAPAQSAAVCSSSFGVGADFVFNVEDGRQATYSLFDTTGNGVIDTSDTQVGGVLTDSVGIRAIVTGVSATICQPGFHPISIQNSTGQSLTCVADDPPVTATGSNRPFDRVQRRIINPPIR